MTLLTNVMPDGKKESPLTLDKIASITKTWLPIVVTLGTIVVGYFVFKAETRYQIELQTRETTSLRQQILSLREDVNENRRDWQSATDTRLTELEHTSLRTVIRVKILEGQPIDD